MTETKRPTINWMDILWLVFLAGLALLPPVAVVVVMQRWFVAGLTEGEK